MPDQSDAPLPSNVQLVLPSTHAVLPGGFTRHAMQPNYVRTQSQTYTAGLGSMFLLPHS